MKSASVEVKATVLISKEQSICWVMHFHYLGADNKNQDARHSHMRVSLHACVQETAATAELVFPMKCVYKKVKVQTISGENGIINKAKCIHVCLSRCYLSLGCTTKSGG